MMETCTDTELAAHWCNKDTGAWKSPCCTLTVVPGMVLLQASGEASPQLEAEVCDGFRSVIQFHQKRALPPAAKEPKSAEPEDPELGRLAGLVCSKAPCPEGYEDLRHTWVTEQAAGCTACEESGLRIRIRREIKRRLGIK
jgi:hypothetical protein